MSFQPSDTTPLRTNPPHFGELGNRPPKSGLKRWLWKKALWVESTFALSMLEPWEKLLVISTVMLLLLLLNFSIYYYLPRHARLIFQRGKYYILGDESPVSVAFAQATGEL